MISSPVDRRNGPMFNIYRFLIITLILSFCSIVLFTRAEAQIVEPVTLVPEPLESSSTEDEGDLGNKTNNDSGSSGSWPSYKNSSAIIGDGDVSIEVNVLETFGADMAGVLNIENGGFSSDIWLGTPYATVDKLFSFMPVHVSSPSMRDLMRRLFLTQAVPPAGVIVDGDFVAKRLELLVSMGDVDSVEKLLAITPGRKTNQRLIIIETDLNLLHGKFVDACAIAQNFGKESTKIYWQQLHNFCAVLSGAYPQAQLGLSLLREVGVDDPAYYQMLDAMMAGETPLINNTFNLTPLNVAIIRASGARFGSDIFLSLPPAVLAAMADNSDLDNAERLDSAEQAAMAGALSIDSLRSLYESMPFDDNALLTPLTTAGMVGSAEARALLYRTGAHHKVDGARVEAIALALEQALDKDIYVMMAKVFNDAIKRVPPRTDFIWFAKHAVRALMIAGDTKSINGWLNLLRKNAALSDEAKMILVGLMPMIHLAELNTGTFFAGSGMEAWSKSEVGALGQRDRAILCYSLLDGLGHPVSSSIWDDLGYLSQKITHDTQTKSSAILPDPVLWQRLNSAALAGQTGEAALLALAFLGEGGPSVAHPVAMAHAVNAMTMVGLESEARALAVEAALAGGL